jgi:hypothetical protein
MLVPDFVANLSGIAILYVGAIFLMRNFRKCERN